MSNKIRSISALSIFLAGAAASFLPGTASAVPAFARQTGMACSSCHFQHFPTLNSFGRAFKAGGYTMSTGAKIEGDNVSLPRELPISVVAKVRYQKDSGNSNAGADYGHIAWPDEAALLVGGRASKDAGYLMELGLLADPENMFLSAKFHFNVAKVGGVQLSVIPFSTDGLGAAYGFELMNTGAQRSQRVIENRKGFSAGNALGLTSGAATGIALVASRHDFFINYSLWGQAWFNTNTDVKLGGLSHYIRAAYMPNIGGMDAGIGFQLWTGDTTVSDGAGGEVSLKTNGFIIDGQLQAAAGGMPVGLYASYGKCKAPSAADAVAAHFASCNNAGDANAFGILGELGVLPGKMSLYAAYSSTDSGKTTAEKTNQWTIGTNYMYAQNIRFEVFVVNKSGNAVDTAAGDSDQTVMVQLFAGF